MFILSLALACFNVIRIVVLLLESLVETIFKACFIICLHVLDLFLLVRNKSKLPARELDHINIKQNIVINQMQWYIFQTCVLCLQCFFLVP